MGEQRENTSYLKNDSSRRRKAKFEHRGGKVFRLLSSRGGLLLAGENKTPGGAHLREKANRISRPINRKRAFIINNCGELIEGLWGRNNLKRGGTLQPESLPRSFLPSVGQNRRERDFHCLLRHHHPPLWSEADWLIKKNTRVFPAFSLGGSPPFVPPLFFRGVSPSTRSSSRPPSFGGVEVGSKRKNLSQHNKKKISRKGQDHTSVKKNARGGDSFPQKSPRLGRDFLKKERKPDDPIKEDRAEHAFLIEKGGFPEGGCAETIPSLETILSSNRGGAPLRRLLLFEEFFFVHREDWGERDPCGTRRELLTILEQVGGRILLTRYPIGGKTYPGGSRRGSSLALFPAVLLLEKAQPSKTTLLKRGFSRPGKEFSLVFGIFF